jgi:hypothetical protein
MSKIGVEGCTNVFAGGMVSTLPPADEPTELVVQETTECE